MEYLFNSINKLHFHNIIQDIFSNLGIAWLMEILAFGQAFLGKE